MAAQTISTSVNHDSASVSGLLDGEQYTINGGTLTVDADVRLGQNAAVIGNVSISNTLGGKFILDATQTWEIPFSSSTGTVPALAALGSNLLTGATSGATGELFRVWGAGFDPVAAGGAMPATGWIKLRSKTGVFSAGETITLPGGATITASSAGKRSWIHVVGASNTQINVTRLGSFESRGDWYDLGVTTGVLGQTIQFPVADICPAIQIETAVGSGVFEWYLNAGARWATTPQFVSNDVRGKYFGCSAGGLISLAVANSGFLPAAGLRIRTPNIILATSASANWNLPVVGTNLSLRWKVNTTGAGVLDLEYITGTAFFAITSSFFVRLRYFASLDQVNMTSIGTPCDIDSLAIGLSGSINENTFQITSCLAGGVLNNVRATCYVSSTFNRSAVIFQDCANFNVANMQAEIFGSLTANTRGTGVNTISLTRCVNFNYQNPICIGARFQTQQVDGLTCSSMQYADCLAGTTQNVNTNFAVDWSASVINSTLDGFSAFAGLQDVGPYPGIVNYNTARDVEFRNIGTTTSPYNANNLAGILAQGSASTNITFRRCYVSNLRTGLLTTTSASRGQTFINVHGDYTDTQVFGFIEMTARGVKMTPSLSEQLAVYGTHFIEGFRSATVGFVVVTANEPTANTNAQCAITSGNPKFTSSNSVVMPTVGDQVTWTMPYSALGHTGLTSLTAQGQNTTNMLYEFQVKTTGDYSNWQTMSNANLAAVGAINPSLGFSLIIRATTVTPNVNNIISFLTVATTSDAASQLIEYPLPVESYELTLSGLQPDSEVRIYRSSDMVEIAGIENVSNSFVYKYPYITDLSVVIVIFALGWQVIRIEYDLGRADALIPIQQSVDRNFLNI